MTGFKRATARERENAVKQRSQAGLAYFNAGMEIFVPKDGDNQIRIVPPLAEDKHATLWGLEAWVYYFNTRHYLSSKTLDEGAWDPILDHFYEVRMRDPKEASTFAGVRRHLMFILDLNEADPILKFWAAPPSLVDDFIRLSKNRRTGALIPLEDPDQGRAIFFTKTGTGQNTSYSGVELDSASLPIEDELADDLVTFESALEVLTPEESEDLLVRMKSHVSKASEDYASEKAPARVAVRTKASVVIPEEEEEYEEAPVRVRKKAAPVEEEEEEYEEAPVRVRKKAAPVEEEEEEYEEAPVRVRKKAAPVEEEEEYEEAPVSPKSKMEANVAARMKKWGGKT